MAAAWLNLGRIAVRQLNVYSCVVKQDFILCKTTNILSACQANSKAAVFQTVRHVSFLDRKTSGEIWKGVTGVSNAGRKKGRAKGSRRRVDLNRMRRLGEGKEGMQWPGLNSPIMTRREVNKMEVIPVDPAKQEGLIQLRDRSIKKRVRVKIPDLQRGWSGNRLPGTSIGAPDPVENYTFEGFDTRVLEFKRVATMTGTLGRKMQMSAFVVTGNGNGLAGYGLGKSPNGRAALRKAMNKAAKHLVYIDRYQGKTVYHNFHTSFHKTRIFVMKKERGYGLVCHRALKTICHLIGIEDMHAKVEGSTGNMQALTKAFFEGLRRQETHQELADRLSLHVVEYRTEMDHVPVVVASPMSNVRQKREEEDEINFEHLYFDGRVPYDKPKREPFYAKYASFRRKQFIEYRRRNQPESRRLRIIHGLQPDYEVNPPRRPSQ